MKRPEPKMTHGTFTAPRLAISFEPGQGLDDVVRRHRQEGVGEHQQRRGRFPFANVDNAREEGHTGTAYAMRKLK